MLIPHTRLLNVPILSLQTGAPLGHVIAPIIDPRHLIIVALHCAGPRIHGSAVLHTSDIREISNMGLIVDSADSLMDPEGLIRLKEVLDFDFELKEQQIVDTQKRKLGKLEGYSIDLESFYIMKLHVRQSMVRNLMGGTLLIDRTQIIEVGHEKIVVAANEARSEDAPARPGPIIENPFRHRGAPQPNGSQAKVGQD